jgi:hypothetical protein
MPGKIKNFLFWKKFIRVLGPILPLRHIYPGSFFLDPEDVRDLSLKGHLELLQEDRALVTGT